jgi:hypothetical protein
MLMKLGKWIAAALLACAWLTAGAAVADGTKVGHTRAEMSAAYDWAVRCDLADSVEAGFLRKSGDAKNAAKFDAKEEASSRASIKLGTLLGYSKERLESNFFGGSTEAKREIDRLAQGYLRADLADCEAIGL